MAFFGLGSGRSNTPMTDEPDPARTLIMAPCCRSTEAVLASREAVKDDRIKVVRCDRRHPRPVSNGRRLDHKGRAE